ncbi:MAG: hypothetical protein LBQ82_07095 [Treponema sp.]|jgi:hypothetical protein|nr:hypothetical protein [Treponema sp.]
MKRIEFKDEQELYKNLWISYAILKNENGTQDDFQFGSDFVYVFAKTENEAEKKLLSDLQKKGDVFESDFEAKFFLKTK